MENQRRERGDGENISPDLGKKEGISTNTKEKVEAAKTYIESNYFLPKNYPIL
jgi:hypothetical protein